LDQYLTIYARTIHQPRHRIRVQFQVGASEEHVQNVWRLGERWIKPGTFQLSRQDDWHAVVKSGHEVIGLCHDDGEGGEVFAIRSGTG
jgi:hypothetical protein